MAAYWIARINVTDPAAYEEYRARGPAAVAKYMARPWSKRRTLTGTWRGRITRAM